MSLFKVPRVESVNDTDVNISLTGMNSLGLASGFEHRIKALVPEASRPAESKLFEEQMKRMDEVIVALQELDDISYRKLIDLSKGRLTPADVLKNADLGALSALLSKTAHMMDILPPELHKKYEAQDILVAKTNDKLYPYARELVTLTRLYCTDKGVNVANPDNLPELPNHFVVDQIESIELRGDGVVRVDVERSGTKDVLFKGKSCDPRILEAGGQLTIGRAEFQATTIFGLPNKNGEKLTRDSDLRVNNKGISRAGVVVMLDTTGARLTIKDCGTLNGLSVQEKRRKVKYDPGANASVVIEGPRKTEQ